MKKSNLITGIIYLLVGVGCLLAALLTETKLDGILFGLAGAGILPGLLLIHHYFYWSSPKRRAEYQEKLDREDVEANDELKVKIRDKSGRYAYTLGLVVISASTLAFAILGALEIVDNAKTIVLYLFGYLAFQIVAGVLIFNHMMKKY